MKQRKSSISFRRGRPGRISKGYGVSVYWRDAPEAEELWNTVSVSLEDRGFAGCGRRDLAFRNNRTQLPGDAEHEEKSVHLCDKKLAETET